MITPLTGIRVVDLSRLLPGPLASLILSDLGAEVISVDSAHNPDYMRTVPPLCDDGVSLFFHALQRGKKRVSLDLRSDAGKAKLRSLLESADVFIESYRPAVLASLGFSDDTLQSEYPKLVVCHLSGYGQEGEKSNTAGHDLNFLAESGLLGLLKNPHVFPFPIADIGAGSLPAVIQIMAALLQRQSSHKGSIIDHNISEHCAALAMPQWVASDASYVLSGNEPQYTVYATLDGHIAVAALEPKFWNALLEKLGVSQGVTREQLQGLFKSRTSAEWESELVPLNICVSIVRGFNDPKAVATRPKGVTVKGLTIGGKPVELPKLPF